MPVVIIADMWTGVSFMAVLLLAGLLALPQEHIEAAEVDGASRWQAFRHVTLPAPQPVLFEAIILRFMDAFRKFEGIQVLTSCTVQVVNDEGLEVMHNGSPSTLAADTVVCALGTRPQGAELRDALIGQGIEAYAIGDCVAPRKIWYATHEGAEIARAI